jgi:hypothetical protein
MARAAARELQLRATDGPPVALAIRKSGRTSLDNPGWLVRSCPFCGKAHYHWLTAGDDRTEMVLPAGCSSTRFYQVREG